MEKLSNISTARETIDAIAACAKTGNTGPTAVGARLGCSKTSAASRIKTLRVHGIVAPDEYGILRLTDRGVGALAALGGGAAQ